MFSSKRRIFVEDCKLFSNRLAVGVILKVPNERTEESQFSLANTATVQLPFNCNLHNCDGP